MFSRPKILFLVSLLFVALLNPKLNPYLLFKFLIFYHSSLNNNKTNNNRDSKFPDMTIIGLICGIVTGQK